jgi:hypothetical protein
MGNAMQPNANYGRPYSAIKDGFCPNQHKIKKEPCSVIRK